MRQSPAARRLFPAFDMVPCIIIAFAIFCFLSLSAAQMFAKTLRQAEIFFVQADGSAVTAFAEASVVGAVPDENSLFKKGRGKIRRTLEKQIVCSSVGNFQSRLFQFPFHPRPLFFEIADGAFYIVVFPKRGKSGLLRRKRHVPGLHLKAHLLQKSRVGTERISEPQSRHGIEFCECFQEKKIRIVRKKRHERAVLFAAEIQKTFIDKQTDVSAAADFDDLLQKSRIGQTAGRVVRIAENDKIDAGLQTVGEILFDGKIFLRPERIIGKAAACSGECQLVFRKSRRRKKDWRKPVPSRRC
jgi:hypothetical protein